MSRIETVLKRLKGQGRKALIPYITAGDPHPDVTVDLMHTLVDAGADIIELGVPFSDPMGYTAFADAAKAAGVDGVLTVDLPPEEAEDVAPLFSERGLDAIFLLAPTTTEDRIRAISGHSSGYVYYVSFKGVTGAARIDVDDVAEKVSRIHSLTALPVGVGFGIRDAETAAAVGRVSDGVIVGSVLVDTIAKNQEDIEALKTALANLLRPMREALDELAS